MPDKEEINQMWEDLNSEFGNILTGYDKSIEDATRAGCRRPSTMSGTPFPYHPRSATRRCSAWTRPAAAYCGSRMDSC